jgi:hypothetical protein
MPRPSPIVRRALVEVGEQPQQPVQALRDATEIVGAAVAVDAEHLLQRREDVVDVRPDPLVRRGRLALRP